MISNYDNILTFLSQKIEYFHFILPNSVLLISNTMPKINRISRLIKKLNHHLNSRYFGVSKTYRPWEKRMDVVTPRMKSITLDSGEAGGAKSLLKFGFAPHNITSITNNRQDYEELRKTVRRERLGINVKFGWISDEIAKNDYQVVIHDGMGYAYGTVQEKDNIPLTIMKMFNTNKNWYHFEATISQRLGRGHLGNNNRTCLYNLDSTICTLARNKGYSIVKFEQEEYVPTIGVCPMINVFYLFQKKNRRLDLDEGTQINGRVFERFRYLRVCAKDAVWNFGDLTI